MKSKNLMVLESIHMKPDADSESTVITTGELGQWIRSGKIWSRLFKYREASLLVSRCHLLNRPFLCALALRLLSRGKCFIKDAYEIIQPITWVTLCRLFFNFISDFIRVPFRLRHHQRTIQGLESAISTDEPKVLRLEYPPLYLRTDLTQKFLAGGSITHTAGIVNNLYHFASAPVVFTTVHVPDLAANSIHEVESDDRNRNFTDILLLETNEQILKQSKSKYAGFRFSFIYQRYSVYNYVGVVLARHFRIPLIIEYNGPEAWVGQNWSKNFKYESLIDKIEILNSKAADVVVVVSQPLKEHLMERGVDSDKILVNPNGVNPETYSPEVDGSHIRRKYDLNNKIVIGFIGTFGKWHGAEVLAQAFGLLIQKHPQYRDRIRLLMIGDGPTRAQVQQELATYGVIKESILTGIVPQEQGPAHLSACDLLVLPHIPNSDGTPFFGSPTKLFEYMAMGKGIIASDLEQIGEILKHDHTAWMVKPGDSESLMIGLKAMIDNPDMSQRFGKAAREEVVAKYTWKEHTRKIIEKLKERCPCD